MAVSGITNQTTNTQATTDRSTLANNYDTFLTLLTSQLQNQDPLAPMDSTQFTQQLVQFSQVEQQIRTNEQLEGLVTQYQASSAGAALSYLGKDAVIQSDKTSFDGTNKASWAYDLDKSATRVTLEVRDSRGRTVFTKAGDLTQGSHLLSWDGTQTAGGTAPAGVYQLVVTATDADGKAVASTTTVRETIMGVDFTGANPEVITASGSRELNLIRAVVDGG